MNRGPSGRRLKAVECESVNLLRCFYHKAHSMASTLYDPEHVAVAELTSLVDIAADAIVTKALYESPGVRLGLFAMDQGQCLTDHSASKPALVQVLDGRIAFQVEGRDHELGPSGWVAMPPGAVHAVRALQPSRFLLTLVKL